MKAVTIALLLLTSVLTGCGAATPSTGAPEGPTPGTLASAAPVVSSPTSAVTPIATLPMTAPVMSGGTPSGWLTQGIILPEQVPGLWFMQWTEANGHISGTAQYYFLYGSSFQSNSSGVTGTHNGAQISITLMGVWGMSFTGMIAGNQLTLFVAQRDGQLMPMVFQPASLQDYNMAIQQFRQRATATVTQGQQSFATAVVGTWQCTADPSLCGLLISYEFRSDGTWISTKAREGSPAQATGTYSVKPLSSSQSTMGICGTIIFGSAQNPTGEMDACITGNTLKEVGVANARTFTKKL